MCVGGVNPSHLLFRTGYVGLKVVFRSLCRFLDLLFGGKLLNSFQKVIPSQKGFGICQQYLIILPNLFYIVILVLS